MSQSDEKTSLEAVVRPHVDLGALDDVLVVTDWRPVAPAGDDAPAGAVEADPGAVGTP